MKLNNLEIADLAMFDSMINPFYIDSLGPINYDISISEFIDFESKQPHPEEEFELSPGSCVFVSHREHIKLPNNICASVKCRYSSILLGLECSDFVYQPGHKTAIIILIKNISKKAIKLKKNQSICSIYFDKLNPPPNIYSGKYQNMTSLN